MRVCCVNVGDKFNGHDYVGKLYRGLKRHTDRSFDFDCVTESKFPGWWAKIELLNPKERTIIIDMDQVVTGDLDFLFNYDGQFCLRVNDNSPTKYDSCLMSVAPGYGRHIVNSFLKHSEAVMKHFYSDQDYISACVTNADTWQKIAPGKTKSYKVHKLESGPDGASLVHFHGKPKPHEVDLTWVKEFWV